MIRTTGTVVTVLVALLAVLIGSFPQRELDWEGTILPLAQEYAGGRVHDEASSSSPDALFRNASQPLQDKVIVVTGCTNGIGLALTRALSRLGATVVGIGRSPHKLAQVQQELPAGRFQGVRADFNDLETVSRAADEIVERWEVVDMLINNAGVHDSFSNLWGTRQSAQGFDRTFAVNYLSHFLLTEKLAATLHNATKPTVLQISSTFHWAVDGSDLVAPPLLGNSNDDFDALPVAARQGGAHGYILFRSTRSYSNSKLAQIYHARTLKRRHSLLSSLKVRLVSACPAWVNTNIGGKNGTFFHTLMQLGFPMDGWGVASSLVALLDYTGSYSTQQRHHQGAQGVETSLKGDASTASDYYINSKMFLVANHLPAWFYNAFGMRVVIIFLIAEAFLFVQRFGASTLLVETSPESYDDQIADSLYEWSYQAIQKYLQ